MFIYNLHGMLSVAAGVFNIAVGAIVLASNPKEPTRRNFFYFSMASSMWVFWYGLMSLMESDAAALLCLQVAFEAVLFIPPTIFLFSRHLIGKPVRSRSAVAIHLLALGFGLFSWMERAAIHIMEKTWYGRFNFFHQSPFGIAFFVALMLYYAAFTGGAYWNFVVAFRRATSPQTKNQLRTILIGFSIGYLGLQDFAVAERAPLYPFGYLALTLMLTLVAYAIARHQLWDINLALKKASLFALTYVFLFAFSLPAMIFLAHNLFSDNSGAFLGQFILWSAGFGLILSTGPFIYAFLTHRMFWLKSNLTSGITHELKSPLGVIQGAVDVLSEQLKRSQLNKDVVGQYVDMIEKSSNRLSRFVSDLLAIAKIQEGQTTLASEPTDVDALVAEVVEEYRLPASTKKVRLIVNPSGAGSIHIDPEKMRHVVSNLISNAVKFSNEGPVELSGMRVNGDIQYSVRDHGRGISRKEMPRIFDRFYHGEHSNKGAGLGLAIAKAWVEAHGGRIWAESEGEGKGTTVTFTVPAPRSFSEGGPAC
jgi:signal transduction histidine kinase